MTGDATTEDTAELSTVAAQDIARLADVGRAAVSNWRRRFADFPEPVGGSSASPLYSLADVEAWLTRHGRQFRLTPSDRIWQQVRGAVNDLRLDDLVGYLGAFLVFLQRESPRWKALAGQSDSVIAESLTATLVAAVPELPNGLVERVDDAWVAIVRAIGDIADEQGHASLFEFLYDRYLQVHSRRYAGVTPAPLADLMVDLAAVSGGSVFDPACGIGTLILAAHARGAATLHGQEVDESSARLAVVRLLLHDSAAKVVVGDSLRHDAFPDERADAVVSNLPFNERSWGYDELTSDPRWEYGLPPRGEPELAWLQHCLAHAKPGGYVVVTMPAGAASRRAGRRIRANLLRAGALRAVISLSGTSPTTTGPDLWVLRRPIDRALPAHVLMIDASADPAIAASTWRSFLADPGSVPTGPSQSMRIIDLLDDEVDVSPTRYVTPTRTEFDIAQFWQIRTRLGMAAATLADRLPDLAASPAGQVIPMTTIGELTRAGAIVVQQAPHSMVTDAGDVPLLTIEDVRLGRPPSGLTQLASSPILIEEGDVVASIDSREPAVRVTTDAGVALGPGLHLLRIDHARIDPHFLAGFLQAAQSEGPARGPSLLGRADVRRLNVPRMSLAEQREYGETFRQLAAFTDSLRETTSLGASLLRLGLLGLADRSLQPHPRNR